MRAALRTWTIWYLPASHGTHHLKAWKRAATDRSRATLLLDGLHTAHLCAFGLGVQPKALTRTSLVDDRALRPHRSPVTHHVSKRCLP